MSNTESFIIYIYIDCKAYKKALLPKSIIFSPFFSLQVSKITTTRCFQTTEIKIISGNDFADIKQDGEGGCEREVEDEGIGVGGRVESVNMIFETYASQNKIKYKRSHTIDRCIFYESRFSTTISFSLII